MLLQKSFLIIALIVFVGTKATAQTEEVSAATPKLERKFKNNLKFSAASVYIPNETSGYRPLAQVGGFYERNFYKSWFVGVGYVQWMRVQNGSQEGPSIGALDYKQDYKMIDLYASCFSKLSSRQTFNIGVGPTYAWGNNFYIKDVYKLPGYYDYTILIEEKKEKFLGLVPQLGYSYGFLNNHIQLGADLKCRWFFMAIRPQFDYGFHIGYSFK